MFVLLLSLFLHPHLTKVVLLAEPDILFHHLSIKLRCFVAVEDGSLFWKGRMHETCLYYIYIQHFLSADCSHWKLTRSAWTVSGRSSTTSSFNHETLRLPSLPVKCAHWPENYGPTHQQSAPGALNWDVENNIYISSCWRSQQISKEIYLTDHIYYDHTKTH